MSSMSSLSIATSGLRAAQSGLNTLGHNMANSGTEGYSRQRVNQHEFMYQNIGYTGAGVLQKGLGTDITSITQIRDRFIDITYRNEASKGSYYDAKAQTGLEIEAIIGELQGEYNTQTVLEDMWKALNELKVYQPGLETRANFMSTAVAFVNKANNVAQRLLEYQHNLDDQVRGAVTRVNQLLESIAKYNGLISEAELTGEHANDYRDSRNLALDELSTYLDISYKEMPNRNIDITCEGRDLIVNNDINKLSLHATTATYSFVEPVFTGKPSTEVLAFSAPATSYTRLYDLTSSVTAEKENDKGILKGLLVARGFQPENYASTPTPPATTDPDYAAKLEQYKRDYFNVTYATIPKVQKEFDTLVHSVITLINDTLSPSVLKSAGPPPVYEKDPNAPYGLDGSQYTEVFVRKYEPYQDRFNAAGELIGEDPANPYSLYTIGNIKINPDLLNPDGYNKLALSFNDPTQNNTGDVEDTRIVLGLMEKWKSGFISLDGQVPLSVDDYYKQFVNGIATQTSKDIKFSKEQDVLITQIENKRQSISGVSLDEEMKNMLIFQHAYNASARMVTMLDSMIDRIVNRTGRVGL